jgi:hypothetical protein
MITIFTGNNKTVNRKKRYFQVLEERNVSVAESMAWMPNTDDSKEFLSADVVDFLGWLFGNPRSGP